MSDLMIFGTGFAAGVLSMAVVHGVHVWLEARPKKEKDVYGLYAHTEVKKK